MDEEAHGSITGAGPHNGVRLELVAWPKGKVRVGQTVHLQVVGKATSSSSGSYAIKPNVALPRGIHNLEVLARSRVAAGAFSFARKVARGGLAIVAIDGSASAGPVTANIHMMAIPKSARPTVPHPGIPLCAALSRKIREFGPTMVDVGGLYSLMIDGKMKETYTAGSNTTLGVGISISGDIGSFSAEGTFTQTSSGADKFPAVVGKIVNEQTPYTYGEYNVCGVLHQVQPEVWVTGGRTVNVTSPLPDKCGHFRPGEVYTRMTGTAGTFTVGVDLKKEIGINLSAQSGYNNNVSITYTFPSEGGFLCGSNNYPSASAWIIMDPVSNTKHLAGRTSRSK